MGTLYVVGTPIGNLKDFSFRAKEALAGAELVLCEDTRVTKKLLDAYDIHTPTRSLHQHTTPAGRREYIELLSEGKRIALVTDAGTPNISDPGGLFVQEAVEALGNHLRVVPIPGACAAIAALSVCGFPADEFVFLGFPPHKKGRETFFDKLVDEKRTIVFYESTHRIEKALTQIDSRMPKRKLCVARELTKAYETLYRGFAKDVAAELKKTSTRGEVVVILAPMK